jgi:hypothetical protein
MPTASRGEEMHEDFHLRRHAAEGLRVALHIYLETSHAGTTVANEGTRAKIAQYTRAVFNETRHLIAARQYVAAILWPTVITASCLATPAWQEIMLYELCNGCFRMRQLEVWRDLLARLYADPDPRAFGPYGLYLMMEKHGLNVANA